MEHVGLYWELSCWVCKEGFFIFVYILYFFKAFQKNNIRSLRLYRMKKYWITTHCENCNPETSNKRDLMHIVSYNMCQTDRNCHVTLYLFTCLVIITLWLVLNPSSYQGSCCSRCYMCFYLRAIASNRGCFPTLSYQMMIKKGEIFEGTS